MKLQKTTFKPGDRVRLKDFDTRETSGLAKEESYPIADGDTHIIGDLAYKLYAEIDRA